MGCGYAHVQAFLLFIWYTMLASALAAGLLIRSFVEIFTSGTVEDSGRCEDALQIDFEHLDRLDCVRTTGASQFLSRLHRFFQVIYLCPYSTIL